jgi:hypothetical protein
MEIVNNLDIDIWKKYVDNHPQGNIFHTPEIFEVFKNAKDFHPEIWAVIDNQRCLKALFLPVRISYLGSVLPDFTTRAVSYGSFLLDQSKDGLKALSILLKEYLNSKRNSIVFTEIRNLYDFGHLKEIIAREGFIFENYLTYLIDLNMSREKLFNKIGKRTRKHIRRAIRQKDISINEVKDRSMVSEVYDLLKKTYKHAKILLANKSLFESAFDILQPAGMAKFLIAEKNGTPAAGSVELIYKDTVYGWYQGFDRKYSKYNPNELLIWNILEWSSTNGYRTYDFGGAGRPHENYGVRDFQAKFGGTLYDFGRFNYIHAPAKLILSKLGYRILRRYL